MLYCLSFDLIAALFISLNLDSSSWRVFGISSSW